MRFFGTFSPHATVQTSATNGTVKAKQLVAGTAKHLATVGTDADITKKIAV
jgi:hypothetical protein